MAQRRSEKVAGVVHREISDMLVRGIKDPRIGLVTITRVRVSDDLRVAKVYFSVLGSEEDRKRNLEGLNSARGFIQKEVGKRVHLRYVPEITFRFDPSLEYADHIDHLIRDLHREEEAIEDE